LALNRRGAAVPGRIPARVVAEGEGLGVGSDHESQSYSWVVGAHAMVPCSGGFTYEQRAATEVNDGERAPAALRVRKSVRELH